MARQDAKTKEPPQQSAPAPAIRLPLGHWEPNNHVALKAFCAWLSRQDAPTTCAFDWDNTCVFGDMGDLALAYQLESLALRLAPNQLAELWQPVLAVAAGAAERSDWQVESDRAHKLFADVHESYALLYPKLAADNFAPGGAKQRFPQAHHRFRAKMLALTQLLASSADDAIIAATYAAIACLWGGFAPSDIAAQVPAIVQWSEAPNRPSHWFSGTGGRAGSQRIAVPSVVRPLPEMQQLMAALTAAGATVYIVSASPELIVRGANSYFRYGVPSEQIIGMRLAEQSRDGRDKFTLPRLAEGTVPTYRRGKVVALEARAKAPPLFVAGDAMTDYEMLTGFAATRLRLIVHRPPLAQPLAALAEQAYAQSEPPSFAAGKAVTLVQGRDAARRGLHPSRQSR